MTLSFLTAWWNLVFLVPFALALLYLGVFVFTGITFGDADLDIHADIDADTDMDMDADADADADHDADADSGTGGHSAAALLGLLGAGKVPLSLGLMILLLLWGLIGFGLNVVLFESLGPRAFIPAITLSVTLLASLTLTGLIAAAIARIVPLNDGAPARRKDLVGAAGDAVYDITDSFGMAAVRSPAGDLLQLPCKSATGQCIPKGTRVVLYAYDSAAKIFSAAPFVDAPKPQATTPMNIHTTE